MGNTRRNVLIEYRGMQVCSAHLWHLVRTDYPDMCLGPGRFSHRLKSGQPISEVVLVRERINGRKYTTSPTPDPAIVSLYRES